MKPSPTESVDENSMTTHFCAAGASVYSEPSTDLRMSVASLRMFTLSTRTYPSFDDSGIFMETFPTSPTESGLLRLLAFADDSMEGFEVITGAFVGTGVGALVGRGVGTLVGAAVTMGVTGALVGTGVAVGTCVAVGTGVAVGSGVAVGA